jgi:hypothetical protein
MIKKQTISSFQLVESCHERKLSNQCLSVLSAIALLLPLSIAPAIAAPKQYISTISAYGDSQPYDNLVRRAEAQAQRVVENAFSRNPGMNEVAVTILGQRNNQEVPLLVMTVSRNNWRRSPNVRTWAQYSGYSAKVLLGYVQSTPTSAPTAVSAPTSTSPAINSPPSVSPGPGRTVITSPISTPASTTSTPAPTTNPQLVTPAPTNLSEPPQPIQNTPDYRTTPSSIQDVPGYRDD